MHDIFIALSAGPRTVESFYVVSQCLWTKMTDKQNMARSISTMGSSEFLQDPWPWSVGYRKRHHGFSGQEAAVHLSGEFLTPNTNAITSHIIMNKIQRQHGSFHPKYRLSNPGTWALPPVEPRNPCDGLAGAAGKWRRRWISCISRAGAPGRWYEMYEQLVDSQPWQTGGKTQRG